ncbi:hypothetical protein ACVFYP_04730 [Roseomonas sp. F4]
MKSFLLLVVALCAGCSVVRGPVSQYLFPTSQYLFNDCLNDNRRAPVPQSVVQSYCVCMAEERSRDPGRPDPRHQAVCERRSGWVQSSIRPD